MVSQANLICDVKKNSIKTKLIELFGNGNEDKIFDSICSLLNEYTEKICSNNKNNWVSESDIILITYADQLSVNNESKLQTLKDFLKTRLKKTFSGVHILPFYPYSSDDGFSVIDYYKVNPDFGNWSDIDDIAKDFDIMFDAVINHISAQSEWFQEYLKGNEKYSEYFIEANPEEDYSSVTRPRALPLLSDFETKNGKKHLWTTFSKDQIDLNYKSEKLFLQLLDVLLFYISKNASLIRLDAIGYIWKKLGTSCINLGKAHLCVQLMREIIDIIAPYVKIITETNVPHKDNITYFGDGNNEAHMVYNFSLPPLTLNSFHCANAQKFSQWAKSLEAEVQSDMTTFFNFLASHDGVGVMPAKGILTDNEITAMVEKAKSHGGLVGYKNNPDGSKSPYEINCNYLEALTHPNESDEIRIKRIVAAHSILLGFRGVPGIYIHSILGSRNYHQGVKVTGANRTINREKLQKDTIEKELDNPNSLRNNIFNKINDLIAIRKNEPAFSPNAKQEVLNLDSRLFAIKRFTQEHELIALTNVSNESFNTSISLSGSLLCENIIDNKQYQCNNGLITVNIEPYSVKWLKITDKI